MSFPQPTTTIATPTSPCRRRYDASRLRAAPAEARVLARGVACTDTGLARSRNEDAFVIDADLGLFAVCDGMGGHRGGDVAARSAIDGIQREVRERRDAIDRVEPDPGAAHQLAEVAAGAVRRAGREVYARASSDPELAGMGCTATVVLVAGNTCAMAHVGDSRLYLLRDGAVHRLSRDHTITAELVRNGALDESDAPDHPYAHVLTRALGIKSSVEVETSCFGLRSGDRLIVCSDGLSDYLLHDGWLAPLAAGAALDGLPRQLVDFALARGGHDNVTVVAIDVGAEAACAGRP